MRRQHEFTLWVVVMALGLHFLEEFALDLRTWLEYVLGVSATWEQFHLINAVVTLIAIGGAVVGWRQPELSLVMPAVVIINAVAFHLGFSIIWWRYSPGTVSALLLFVPAGVWAFVGAHRDGVLTPRAVWVAVAAAVAIHLWLLAFHLVGPPG
ncbi:MAG: HXXEE domain-containing protein [Acidobacteria bacterium]|nr:HXXEE domain-containing protein [Acidobacteriota bacterium]